MNEEMSVCLSSDLRVHESTECQDLNGLLELRDARFRV